MIITELIKRGHYLSVFDEEHLPPLKALLECDVLMDMSTITEKSFYYALAREYKSRKSKGPVMIDPPEAIINSFDKRLTHDMFPDLVPESYVLTGKNNEEKIERFKSDEFVVIKPLQGWWGEGVERLSPQNALKKHNKSKDLIVQKYVPPSNGIGRIVTLFHKGDFEIVVAYTRVSRSWRTGTDVSYTCKKEPVTKKLREFALSISQKCGLYLNGIDYFP
jgi:glutathione synthase/RimK-type ligase-like ATP-grasp enzyme